ncbi:MAG: hypothetical protein H7836_04835 [Magnetococcus sp. YQC-3]
MDIKDEISELIELLDIKYKIKEYKVNTIIEFNKYVKIGFYWPDKIPPAIYYKSNYAGGSSILIENLNFIEDKIDLNEVKNILEEYLINRI